jgi:hypothetical protein
VPDDQSPLLDFPVNSPGLVLTSLLFWKAPAEVVVGKTLENSETPFHQIGVLFYDIACPFVEEASVTQHVATTR